MQLVPALTTTARITLGLTFAVFGLNGFLGFMPSPPVPEDAGAFLGALGATGYMFPMIKGAELVAGALLLAGRFVPLALILLAPVIVNIVLFHLVLTPVNPIALAVLGLELFLAWRYREHFHALLDASARPVADERAAVGRGLVTARVSAR
jgi:uncharacterized membrane protein YphA (DoxX/SURF4 family)